MTENKKSSEPLIANEENFSVVDMAANNDIIKNDITIGNGSINALTLRSFVSPKAARPNIQNYEKIPTKEKRGSYIHSQMPNFLVTSSRQVFDPSIPETGNENKKGPKKFGP